MLKIIQWEHVYIFIHYVKHFFPHLLHFKQQTRITNIYHSSILKADFIRKIYLKEAFI